MKLVNDEEQNAYDQQRRIVQNTVNSHVERHLSKANKLCNTM